MINMIKGLDASIKQTKALVLLGLFLLLIGQQAKAQLVTVFSETFENYGFTGDYVVDKPTNPGLEFLNDIGFTYNSRSDGQMAGIDNTCIFTKNSCSVGHDSDSDPGTCYWSHPDHTGNGYYLFAVASSNDEKTIYQVTIPVVAGEPIEFGVWARNIAEGYNIKIEASGTGLNNTTKTTDSFISDKGEWIPYSLSLTATRTGDITFRIIEGPKDGQHKFGIDDITIKKKSIITTSPASSYTHTKTGTTVSLSAKYNDTETAGYQWQKQTAGVWSDVTGASGTTTGATTLNFTPATESTAGYVFYRLVVGGYYSDVITVEYTSTEYLFKEDFGGNYPSTDITNSSGASGDWWLMSAPDITTDFTYGDNYSWDKLENAYGQKPISINNNKDFVVTKLSGVQNYGIPGYSDVDEGWNYGGDCCYDDNTFPGDVTKGYFMNCITTENQYKTVYAATIPVTSDMHEKYFTFKVAHLVMWGISDSNPNPLQLRVEYNDGTTSANESYFSVANSWKNSELIFGIPKNYTGDKITIRALVKANDGGFLRFGLDDISVTPFEPFVNITSPTEDTYFCDWNWVNMIVSYFVPGAVEYQWQYSSTNADGSWTGISGTATGLQASSGTFNRYTSYTSPDAGYYRVAITQTAGDYTNAWPSNVIRLINKEGIDQDKLTITQTGAESGTNLVGPDENFTLTAGYKSLTNPVYKWEKKDVNGDWQTVPDVTNTITIPSYLSDLPASGTVTSSLSSYRIGLISDEFCETIKNPSLTITNNRWSEDFKSGASDRMASADALKAYTISGLSYRSDDAEVMYSGYYTFTKSTFQNDKGNFSKITGYNGNGGYFMQVSAHAHDATDSPITFYETTLELCSGGKYSFRAMIANLIPKTDHKLQFAFRVKLEEIDPEGEVIYQDIHYTTEGNAILTSDWFEYGFDFLVPNGTKNGAIFKAVCTIESSGYQWSNEERNFGIDNISITRLSPAQIIIPESTDIMVLEGSEVYLKGIYVSCGITGADPSAEYYWQKSFAGGNSDEEWEEIDGKTGATNITTDPIDEVVYYRLVTIGSGPNNNKAVSKGIKITPVKFASLGKTYYVCPDNMPDGEATENYREGNDDETSWYLPGLVSKEEKGYLPSPIRMEITSLYGITYKWYDVQTEGTAIPDRDEYDPNQKFSSQSEVVDPIFISDEKSNTLSVQNVRRTDGKFPKRTYWVELCDATTGVPIPNTDRIEIKLEPGYLCGSTDTDILSNPMVSPNTSRRINRDNFGGTSENDLDVSETPLSGIDYLFDTSQSEDVAEGGYKVRKISPRLGNDSWTPIEDHIYEDVASENPHGYSVAINASEDPGLFYIYQLENLGACDGLNLLFTGWLTSPVNWAGSEKANLMFRLTNTTTKEILVEYVTGNLPDKDVKWKQFGFMFTKQPGVDNLTLEIINNNFGTAGGNDVLMDDIEVWLNIPPITLVPALDSYVCVEKAEDQYAVATLEGTYTDDGTLGKYLDYRWEYSVDASTWTSLGAQDENGDQITYGSLTTGVLLQEESTYIIGNFKTPNNGYYRLVVGQAGAFENTPLNYDCVAVSNPRKLTFSGSVAKFPTPTFADNRNLTAVCHSEGSMTITNFDAAKNIADGNIYYDYTWVMNGVVVQSKGDAGASATALQLDLTNYKPGFHTVSLTVENAAECDKTVTHNFLIYPETTTWTAKGASNNWNDYRNWSNGVPGYCTDAIIPYNTMDVSESSTDNPLGSLDLVLFDHYPLLINPTVETLNEKTYPENQSNLSKQRSAVNDSDFSLRPACDNIYFQMGASVTRTDYLNYTSAKVDLDVLPNRWYMVSAPLGSMYSGDYFVIGNVKRQNPTVYMMKYQTENPQTKEEAIAGDFSNPFNTLTEELYPGLGYTIWVDDGNDIGVNVASQPFRFPKDDKTYDMWDYEGNYKRTVEIPERGNLGRFTYEPRVTNCVPNAGENKTESDFTADVLNDSESYTTMLIGNPFMSHLDFASFAKANSGIETGYYVWTPEETFEAVNPSIFSGDPNEIAPMQSFIVKKNGIISSLDFTFDMAVLPKTKNNVLRSTATGPVLRLDVLRQGIAHSNVRLKYDPAEDNGYNPQKDMLTLFSEETTYPAVLYALSDNKAASIRTIGDLSEEIELGIRTDEKGLLTLRWSGLETWDVSYRLYLEDRLTGTTISLDEATEYAFNNGTGNVQGRFFITFVKSGESGIEDIPSSDSSVRIYANNDQIIISSSVNDPIESVKIYSLDGKLLYEKPEIDQSYFSLNSPVKTQMVIVSVVTKHHQKTEKLIMK